MPNRGGIAPPPTGGSGPVANAVGVEAPSPKGPQSKKPVKKARGKLKVTKVVAGKRAVARLGPKAAKASPQTSPVASPRAKQPGTGGAKGKKSTPTVSPASTPKGRKAQGKRKGKKPTPASSPKTTPNASKLSSRGTGATGAADGPSVQDEAGTPTASPAATPKGGGIRKKPAKRASSGAAEAVPDGPPREEQTRLAGLFKSFADRGKVASNLVPTLVKEALAPTGLPERSKQKLLGMGKEALCSEAGLQAKGFMTWYCAVAWPVIVGQKQRARDASPESAGAGNGAGAAAAPGGCAADSTGATPPRADAVGEDGAEGGAVADVASAHPSGVHIGESRRVLALLDEACVPDGERGRVVAAQLPGLLRRALEPVVVEPTVLLGWLNTVSPGGKVGTIGAGQVLRFWFDVVWPEASPRLLPAHHAPPSGSKPPVRVMVEYDDDVDRL